MICYNWKIIKSGALPPVKIGEKPMKTQKDKRGALIWIPLGILLMVSMWMLCYDFVLACVNYSPIKGVFGSTFVGMQNFDRVFSNYAFGNQLGNSLVYSLLNIVCALVLGAPIALLLGLIPSRPVKAMFAGLALAFALVPDIFWVQSVMSILPARIRVDPNFYPFVYMLCKLAPLTGMAVFAGLSLNLAENKSGIVGALLVGLLPLLTVFTPEAGTTMLLQNAINQNISDTVAAGVYRTGFMQGQYSYAEAMSLIGIFFNFLVGIGFLFVLGAMAKRKKRMAKVAEPRSAWFGEGALGAVGTVAAGTFIVLGLLFGGKLYSAPMVGHAALNTVGTAMLAVIFIFGVSMLLFVGTRYCRSGFGLMLITFLLLQMSTIHMSHYLAARSLGMINTILPGVFGVFFHPAFLTVLMVLMACRPTSGRQMVFASLGTALIAGAVAAGDWYTTLIYVSRQDTFTLPMVVRQTLYNAEAASAGSSATLVMIIVVVVFAALGAMMTFAGLAGSRLEEAQKPAEEPSATDALYGTADI